MTSRAPDTGVCCCCGACAYRRLAYSSRSNRHVTWLSDNYVNFFDERNVTTHLSTTKYLGPGCASAKHRIVPTTNVYDTVHTLHILHTHYIRRRKHVLPMSGVCGQCAQNLTPSTSIVGLSQSLAFRARLPKNIKFIVLIHKLR